MILDRVYGLARNRRFLTVLLPALGLLVIGGYVAFNESGRSSQGARITSIERTVQRACNNVCRDVVVERVLRELRGRGVDVPPREASRQVDSVTGDGPVTTTTPEPPATTPIPSVPSPGPPAPSAGGGGGGGGSGIGGTPFPSPPEPGDPSAGNSAADAVEDTLDAVCTLTEQLAGLCL